MHALCTVEERLSQRRAFNCTILFSERNADNGSNIDHLWASLYLGTADLARTSYSSILTLTSASYCRDVPTSSNLFYYEALKITVSTAGNYTIRSSSPLDTCGYLYNNTFDTTYPSRNMLQFNDDDAGSTQFLLSMWLQTMTDYILVATTFYPFYTGAFSVVVQGPAVVSISVTNATGQCWHDIPQWLWLIRNQMRQCSIVLVCFPSFPSPCSIILRISID